MKVTQESDYAIRICCALDEVGEKLDAESIAVRAAITRSIALKVLGKLKVGGIVVSHKGAEGGYSLKIDPKELTAYSIIKAVEGDICISRCLSDNHRCSKNGDNKACCKMHIAFDAINKAVEDRLRSITVRSITSPEVSSLDIIDKLK